MGCCFTLGMGLTLERPLSTGGSGELLDAGELGEQDVVPAALVHTLQDKGYPAGARFENGRATPALER
jgi:hypothetical protein